MAQAKKKPKGKNGAEVVTAMGAARRRAAIVNAIDGTLVIGEAGIVQVFDPAAERVFGSSASEVVGRVLTNRHHNTDDNTDEAAVLMWRCKAA